MVKQLDSLIRSVDKFGIPVQINFRGDTEYQTVFGGICSILINLIVLWFSIEKIIQLHTYENQSVTKSTVY